MCERERDSFISRAVLLAETCVCERESFISGTVLLVGMCASVREREEELHS